MSRLPARRPLSRGLALLLPLLVLPAVAPASSSAQPATAGTTVSSDGVDSLFTPLEDFTLAARNPAGRPATVRPRGFSAFRLDLGEARAELAPTGGTTTGPLEVTVPDPSGAPVTFSVVEQSVMEPELQAAHPEIRTYAGRAVDGTARSVSLGVTRLGFFASVRSPGGGESWYVDPAYRQTSATDYLSYYGAAVPADSAGLVERGPIDTEKILAAAPPEAQRPAPDAIVTQRTFRMAFVTDPTYANYFGTSNVASAKAALLARTNQIYNDDLAIKFVLVAGTDKLNLDTPAKASDPNGVCGASACYDRLVYQADPATAGDTPDGCDGALLDRNEFVLGQIIGADNYDIGHIGLGVNGGGIAGLGVVGGGSKASGCTGLPAPTGDFYAVDYFSHEVGHQMGGNHTFDGDQVNCSATNRNGDIPVINPSTAVEPGSGSSVMAYAGICGQDNLQPHSDPYFSQRSIDEIDTVVTDAPSTASELQTVTLNGFATGDVLELTYDDASPLTVRIPRDTSYDLGGSVITAVQTLTGCLPTVMGYDGGTFPGVNGFSVAFDNDCAGTTIGRLGVSTASTGVTGFVGVQDNGGPETNQGSALVTANHAPKVTAPADKTIPVRTPFTLSGSATDVDGNPLTYLWEQNNAGGAAGTSLVNNTKTAGALFRVFGVYADVSPTGTLMTPSPGLNLATADATRSFPDMAQVLAGNTNAATGACPTAPAAPASGGASNVPRPIVECFSEFLPTASYGNPAQGSRLDFRLTARDAVPGAGGTQSDDVRLTLNTAAGPFLVTSRPTAGTTAAPGSTETVTWSVAGTNTTAMALDVRILLSTDGGLTFPTVLAARTPNDGTQPVTLPNVNTDKARIKIEAFGNYFFDVNDAPFTIGTPPPTTGTGTGQVPSTPGTPGTTGTGTTGTAASRAATKTRIRLPRVEQVRGRESTPLTYAVVSSRRSVGTAGRVVIRVDGRKVRNATVPVVPKQGNKVVGGTYRLSRNLDLGSHKIKIRFKPADPLAYRGSRSRTVTLTVVRSR